jgi:L-aspartate semialdehyde sulfurtransferase ferredoxin
VKAHLKMARKTVYTQIYLLRFPKDTSDQPFIYRLVKEYDIEFNILKADILLQREGIMIIELKGSSKSNVVAGLDYLKAMGVKIERLATRIRRDDENCFQCGACTGVCSSGALYIQRPSMEVVFDAEKCTGCSLCVPICPVRAMEVSLNDDWILNENLLIR